LQVKKTELISYALVRRPIKCLKGYRNSYLTLGVATKIVRFLENNLRRFIAQDFLIKILISINTLTDNFMLEEFESLPEVHGVTSQNTILFILTAVKTSDPASLYVSGRQRSGWRKTVSGDIVHAEILQIMNVPYITHIQDLCYVAGIRACSHLVPAVPGCSHDV
jgi:hypothetical protein